jgi:hypothetical protein
VTIGPDPLPVPTGSLSAGTCCILTYVNLTHPTATLAAPSGGVITRWRVHEPPLQPGVMRPRVLRPAPGGLFQGVASGAEVPVASSGTLVTHATRLPIAAGDYFGVNANTGPVAGGGGTGFQVYVSPIADGSIGANPQGNGGLITVNADIEPDADGDGFGDETQDMGGAAPIAPVEVGRIGPATTVTFTNASAGPVTPEVTLDGAAAGDFLTVADRCDGVSVPAGGTCVVVLRFAPGVTGDRRARLVIRGGRDALGQVLQGSDVTLGALGTAPPAPPAAQANVTVPLVALLVREDLAVRRGRAVVASVLSTLPGDAVVQVRRRGRVVATARTAVQPGRTRIRLPVARLARGRYALALVITAGGQTARDAGRLTIRRRVT